MKQFVLLFFLWISLIGKIQAQGCVPNPEGIPDTAFGVFPLPFIADERPDGGITDTVCLNRDFDYTFTIKIGDTLTLGNFTAPVNKVYFEANGAVGINKVTANASIQSNFQYVCDPPNCVFTANQLGCVKLFGKATSSDQIGQHEITIKGKIELQTILGPFTSDVEFPNQDIAALRGNYYLFVQDQNSSYCMSSNTYAVFAPEIELTNRPNPFSDFTQIQVRSKEEGDYELRVLDMLGRIVKRERISLHFGENSIDFDGRILAEGLYVYTISNGHGGVSGKMVVNRGR